MQTATTMRQPTTPALVSQTLTDLDICDYTAVKNRLRLRLMSSERHQDVSERFYGRQVGKTDLYAVISVDVSGCLPDADGAHALTTPAVRNRWLMQGYSDEEIFAAAYASESRRNYSVKPIWEMLSGLGAPCEPAPTGEVQLHIVSTADSSFSACGIILPPVQSQIRDRLGDPVFVLPSSVHECLVLPADGAPEAQNLAEMVKQINKDVVQPRDILSDHVYMLRDGVLETVV